MQQQDLESMHAPLAIAFITSLSVSGSAVSPVIVGWVKTVMGDIRYGIADLIMLALLGAMLYLLTTAQRSKDSSGGESYNSIASGAFPSLRG